MKLVATSTRPSATFAGCSWFNQPRVTAALGSLLVALTLWTFLPVLQNGFVNLDDPLYVYENPRVTTGLTWKNVAWAFTSIDNNNWHPLTWLSHMLDFELFGLQPSGHHLTNLLLHATNTLLLFLVFSRMTGTIWRSFFVAAIFAVHPLRVESIAWASERKDVLSMFFLLLTLLFYLGYVNRIKAHRPRKKVYYGLSLLCFVLGLMSKPSVVTLPFILLLLDYWPLKRFEPRSLIIEKIPFFLLSVASSWITFIAQKHGGAVATVAHVSVPFRLENSLVSYARYLGKIFWPANLSILYPMPPQWPMATVIFSALVLASLSFGAIFLRRQKPFLLVGWLWFLGTLVPMIGLVQVGSQSMADRYTYISGIGVLVMLAWGIPDLVNRITVRVMICSVATVVITLCTVTRQQIGYWKNSETLFQRELAVSENKYAALVDLGGALANQGRADEAVATFQAAIRLDPQSLPAHDYLATVFHGEGRFDAAAEQLEEILKIKPDAASAQNQLGAILFDEGKINEAISHYREAASLDPNSAPTFFNWGIALCSLGRYPEAVDQLGKAVALEPNQVRARYNLGLALSQVGRSDDAIREFRAALDLDPKSPKTHYRLGLSLAQTNRKEEALGHFKAALALQPNYPGAAQAIEKLSLPQ